MPLDRVRERLGLDVVERDPTCRLKLADEVGRPWAVRVSRFGIAARGVVFGVIGVLFVNAALHANPQEAGGVSDALRTLRQQPYGVWILAVIGIGLVAYGVYEFVRARYRRIETT